MTSIKIGTYNVRGMRDIKKRSQVYKYVREKSFDVIFLQETHSSRKDQNFWTSQWGGKVVCSHGSSNSRGTAIYFRKNLQFRLKSTYTDDNGRIALAHIELENEDLVLMSIYAPNADEPQFFSRISNIIQDYPSNDTKIIAGDFNLVLDDSIDRLGGSKISHLRARQELLSTIQRLDLVDIWRVKNPELREYTWERKKPQIIKERLDFILLTAHKQNMCKIADMHMEYLSDHSIPYIAYTTCDIKRGPGFWKFNNKLLNDKTYVDIIRNLINTEKMNIFENISKKWDFIKSQIRGETIRYCAQKRRSQENMLRLLEQKIQKIKVRLETENTDRIIFTKEQDQKVLAQLEEDRQELMQEKTHSSMFRTRQTWNVLGEKPTKYFLGLEKSRFAKRNRFSIIHNNWKHEGPRNVLNIQDEFYTDLYATRNVEMSDEYLEDLVLPQLNQTQKNNLDREITDNEIKEALWDMKLNKIPGIEGITVEFYKFFWQEISALVCGTIHEAKRHGFTQCVRRGQISLMEKPKKDLNLIENWRPLSLLNIDYKIYAKLLSKRMQDVMQDIIHLDQSGFIKGRGTMDNVQDLLCAIQYCNELKIPAILTSYDYRKAFDSVEYKILWQVMRKFNFGETFISFVQNLEKDAESCTINYGFTGNYFPIQRGLRQGCSMSALLFILVVEILGQKIRQSDVQGIQIKGTNKKHTQYADDLWSLILASQQNFDRLNKVINTFTKQTGLEINYNKTEIMRVGTLRQTNAKFYSEQQIKWSDKITILGFEISPTLMETIDLNFKRVIQKVKALLDVWKNRNLTLIGKIQVINSLAIPILVQVFTCLPPPKDARILKELKSFIIEFIWGGGQHKIKYDTMIQSRTDGGLGLVDIYAKRVSLRLSWVKKILNQKEYAWENMLSILARKDIKEIWMMNIDPKQILKQINLPKIFEDIAEEWAKISFTNPTNKEEILTQYLWYNQFLKIGNTVQFYQDLNSCGITQVRDIYCIKEKRLFKLDEIIEIYGPNFNYMHYMSIINAVPKKWLSTLKKSNEISVTETMLETSIRSPRITKWVYQQKILQYNCKIGYVDLARVKWSVELNANLAQDQWHHIRMQAFILSPNTKLQSFQFRFLSGRITTNSMRSRYEAISPLCTFCKQKIETIQHLFWECEQVKKLWGCLQRWFSYMLRLEIQINREDIFFCSYTGQFNQLVNTVYLITKQYIYAAKCMDKQLSYVTVMQKIREEFLDEQYQCILNGSYLKFEKKWSIYKTYVI